MDMDPAGLTPRRRAAVRGLRLGAAAAAKGLREDVGAAAGRRWKGLSGMPKQERPLEEEAAAGYELRESRDEVGKSGGGGALRSGAGRAAGRAEGVRPEKVRVRAEGRRGAEGPRPAPRLGSADPEPVLVTAPPWPGSQLSTPSKFRFAFLRWLYFKLNHMLWVKEQCYSPNLRERIFFTEMIKPFCK